MLLNTFDQNRLLCSRFAHCTAQPVQCVFPTSTSWKIEKNPGIIGERAQMSEVVYGMPAQNSWANRLQVSGFSGMVLERQLNSKSAAS